MRVLATLYEKGLDFELVPVDMKAGAHKQEPLISLNVRTQLWFSLVFIITYLTTLLCSFLFFQPFGQIPALLDGDLTLFG